VNPPQLTELSGPQSNFQMRQLNSAVVVMGLTGISCSWPVTPATEVSTQHVARQLFSLLFCKMTNAVVGAFV